MNAFNMTYEDVEKILPSKFFSDGTENEAQSSANAMAYRLTRVAVLKQISQKPIQYEIHKQYDVELCPCCRSVVRNSEFISPYCGDCGQKIDWSKE